MIEACQGTNYQYDLVTPITLPQLQHFPIMYCKSGYRVLQNLCNKEFEKLNHFQIWHCTKTYIVYGLVWLVWSVLPLSYYYSWLSFCCRDSAKPCINTTAFCRINLNTWDGLQQYSLQKILLQRFCKTLLPICMLNFVVNSTNLHCDSHS